MANPVDTTNPSVLRDLADRCEREEQSRQLDADIFQFAGGIIWDREYRRAQEPCGCPPDTATKGARLRSPNYTTSLDAAVTLVPEHWYVAEVYFDNDGWNATLSLGLAGDTVSGNNAPSEALARCAAALRAQAAYFKVPS